MLLRLQLSSVAVFSLIYQSLALPSETQTSSRGPVAKKVTTVHRFPNGNWIENLAIRTNGGVLLTDLTKPKLFYIDPFSANTRPSTIFTFPPPANGAIGVSEYEKDIFYVGTSNINISSRSAAPGSGQLWRIDMRNYPQTDSRLVANITGSVLINGITTLPASKKILIADTGKGLIWRVDALSHAVDIAIDIPALKPPANPCFGTPVGVNGIHAVPQRNLLFYTNSGACSYGKIPITADGSQKGTPSVLFKNNTIFPDDFALVNEESSDAVFIANAMGTQILYTNGKSNSFSTVANVEGPTAVKRGRRANDEKSLYVTNSGGADKYAQNPIPVGGALTKIALEGS